MILYNKIPFDILQIILSFCEKNENFKLIENFNKKELNKKNHIVNLELIKFSGIQILFEKMIDLKLINKINLKYNNEIFKFITPQINFSNLINMSNKYNNDSYRLVIGKNYFGKDENKYIFDKYECEYLKNFFSQVYKFEKKIYEKIIKDTNMKHIIKDKIFLPIINSKAIYTFDYEIYDDNDKNNNDELGYLYFLNFYFDNFTKFYIYNEKQEQFKIVEYSFIKNNFKQININCTFKIKPIFFVINNVYGIKFNIDEMYIKNIII